MQPLRWYPVFGILTLSLALTGYARLVQSTQKSELTRLADFTEVVGIPLVRREEAHALWQQPQTVFLDVRTVGEYEFGHIAGALNLPEEEFERQFPAVKSRLEQARAIVVYCKSRDCAKSLWTAIRLVQQGLRQTKIYPNGWNEWYNEHLPNTVRAD
jgi:rhodanese-related sulfurtransferase